MNSLLDNDMGAPFSLSCALAGDHYSDSGKPQDMMRIMPRWLIAVTERLDGKNMLKKGLSSTSETGMV
jgi:hypothetical protein